MENFTFHQNAIGSEILRESGFPISEIDPLTILIILRIIINILIFLGENWQTPAKLPLWKKLAIKIELISRFGRVKAKKIETIIYSKVAKFSKEEVKSFVEVENR